MHRSAADIRTPHRILASRSASVLALTAALWGGGGWMVQAQAAAPGDEPGAGAPGAVEEVVVTGSRLSRSTFTAPNPVTVLNAQDIEKLGLTNVGSVLAQLPQNSNFFAANNVGLGNFNVGAQLANLRGLNPFFGTRTLTLIDTRRVVPTTTGGGVDITLIPSMLVARTETVTGGASAVYGSDAVAGVVNIILDTKLKGLKAQVDFGQTSRGDGKDLHASAAYGFGFAGGKGHFVIGGEYQHTDDIGICSQERDWCAQNYGMFTNTGYATPGAPGFGQPHYIIGPNATAANQSLTGVLAPCVVPVPGVCIAGPQVQFNQAGNALVPYTPGLYADGAGFFGFRQGGDNLAVGAYDSTTMRPDVKRYTGLAHVDYTMSNNIEAFLEGSVARSDAVNPVANGAIGPYSLQVGPGVFVGSHINPDNAFLSPAVAAAIGPLGAQFGRNVLNVVSARNETQNTTWRVVAGLKGELSSKWAWDAYAEYGKNINDQALHHSVVNGGGTGYDFLNFALDAVRSNPNDPNSAIVCRAAAPAYGAVNPLAAGCVPLNLFGVGNASQAAIDYAFRTLKENSTYTQQVLSGNLRGELYEGWGAGPIRAAFGGEYRREHGKVGHDLANQPWYNQYFLSYGLDYAGTISVLEGYGELNVPLLKELPLIHYLEMDGAIRVSRNKNTNDTAGPNLGQSASRNITSWKISGIWDLTDWLRLRGTRSRDVRAAQFRELYQSYAAAGGAFGSVNNPWNNGITDPANIATGGDINLKPEKADTTTVGVVLSPSTGPLARLRLSADWYKIRINGAIVGPPFGIGAQNIVNQCFQGVQAFCDRMTGEGTADILTITNTAANLGSFVTKGVDFEAAYSLPLADTVGLPGDLNMRVIASYLYDMTIDAGLGATPINYGGQSGPTGAFGGFNTSPKWQGNAILTYNNGPFSATVQARYVGPGKFLAVTATGATPVAPGDPGYTTTADGSINTNHVDSAIYVNLSTSYELSSKLTLFGSVNNLFDKNPPVAPGGNGYPTNPVYFDTYGTAWKVGVRLRY